MKMLHHISRYLLAGTLVMGLWGCGSSNSSAPPFQAGAHPSGWSAGTVHGTQYRAQPDQCSECHGSDLKGGISKVSCDTCHPGYPHATDWALPLQHGYAYGANPQSCKLCHGANYLGGISQVSCINNPVGAQPTGCHPNPANMHTAAWKEMDHGSHAKLAPSAATPLNSLLACRNCHGYDFKGTPLSENKNCFNANSCHFHPEGMPHALWNGMITVTVTNHAGTSTSPRVAVENAPVCFQCHNRVQSHLWYNMQPTAPTPIGNLLTPFAGNPDPNAAPGCYNSTLCHGLR
jgi:hypothetical protein